MPNSSSCPQKFHKRAQYLVALIPTPKLQITCQYLDSHIVEDIIRISETQCS
ncbi:MAG: hypothetical protein ACFFB1_17525 [Promethearchaeota archaeon]